MRIIQIGQFPTHVGYIRGGVEASVYGLAKELSKYAEVEVMDIPRVGTDDRVECFEGMTVYRFRNTGCHQKDAAKRVNHIVEIILDLHPSVCHIHGTSPFCWRMLRDLKRQDIPVALTVHGVLNVEKKKALKNHFSWKGLYQYIYQGIIEKRILSSINNVIVDTEYVKEAIKSLRLKRMPLMKVIPQGIDQHFFDLSCSSSSSTVLSVGAFSRRKGHFYLIKAFEQVCEKDNQVLLTICGSSADAQYLAEIESYVSNSPFKDRIQLVVDASKEALYALYGKAHIFALHSQEESQGIVLAEAMATGLPIVSTRVGGIPYVVENGACGLITEYGNVHTFADSMLYLLNSPTAWLKMSNQCRTAAMKYSWTIIGNQITNVYHDIH